VRAIERRSGRPAERVERPEAAALAAVTDQLAADESGPLDETLGAGTLCLDLVATMLDWEGVPVDLITEPRGLAAWFTLVDLPQPAGGLTAADLDAARELRAAAHALARAALRAEAPAPDDIRCINAAARRPTPVFLLRPSGREKIVVEEYEPGSSLAVIARDLINLLAGPELDRLRECAGCGSLFFDRSPSGRRKWCSMRRCGERVASARYRRRRAAAAATATAHPGSARLIGGSAPPDPDPEPPPQEAHHA
jgi:predicted RNA-binding Zn ribbon-like protein